jgi:alkanesulfonate monooxygenase SsuD/methylene tetrahydromethanopterin reductase-like flavin-dependent oxidoreductase (luciferase family)
MAAGGLSTQGFGKSVPLLQAALEIVGRDPATFPISKRVFVSVHERPEIAQAELRLWFTEVYGDPELATKVGVYGTPRLVREQLEEVVALGATHVLLNPVTRFTDHVEVLAEVARLP